VSERLREIADRLSQIAEGLRADETDDERAGELAREAGELAAEAGTEADRVLREVTPDE
jgi:hypothetical protein